MAVAASIRSPVRSICMARFGPDGPGERHHRRGAEQADAHAGRGEAGTGLGDGEVAAGHQLAARRGGDAVHPGDDRLRDRLHRRHQRCARVEQLGRLVAFARDELGEVVAGGERGTGAGDHHDPARRRFEAGLQLAHEVERQGVAPVGSVERDPGDHLALVHLQVLPRHEVDGTLLPATAWRAPRRAAPRTRRRASPPRRASRRPCSASSSAGGQAELHRPIGQRGLR